jgi:hypothetical protein
LPFPLPLSRPQHNHELMNEYEQQRLERIRRNEEHMRRLGLVQAASEFAAATTTTAADRGAASARKRARATTTTPHRRCRNDNDDDDDDDHDNDEDYEPAARRSRRLQGGAAERPGGLADVDDLMALGGAAGAAARQRGRDRARASGDRPVHHPPPAAAAAAPAVYDNHNAYRLSYMSEPQLWRRVEQISNAAKLRSFAEALEAAGRRDMARRARERLGEDVPPEEEEEEEEDEVGSGSEDDEDGDDNENKENSTGDDEAAAEARLARRRVAELPPAKLVRLAGRIADLGELKALIEALEEEGGNVALDGARERAWARLEALRAGGGGGAGSEGGNRKTKKTNRR